MGKKFILAAAAAAFLTVGTASVADAKTCLPASVRGHTTGLGFQGSYYARGKFRGLEVTELRVDNARVTIRARGGATIYNGGLREGQFIPFTRFWDLVWTGFAASNHMNGICVEPRY